MKAAVSKLLWIIIGIVFVACSSSVKIWYTEFLLPWEYCSQNPNGYSAVRWNDMLWVELSMLWNNSWRRLFGGHFRLVAHSPVVIRSHLLIFLPIWVVLKMWTTGTIKLVVKILCPFSLLANQQTMEYFQPFFSYGYGWECRTSKPKHGELITSLV